MVIKANGAYSFHTALKVKGRILAYFINQIFYCKFSD
jgi:hypothetical protein